VRPCPRSGPGFLFSGIFQARAYSRLKKVL